MGGAGRNEAIRIRPKGGHRLRMGLSKRGKNGSSRAKKGKQWGKEGLVSHLCTPKAERKQQKFQALGDLTQIYLFPNAFPNAVPNAFPIRFCEISRFSLFRS